MPINRYFKGHGDEVMASLRKAHPKASEKKIKSLFYATANSRGMTPTSHGTMPIPADIGAARQKEAVKLGGFSDGPTVTRRF